MKPENSAASIDASMLDASPGWSAARPAATERESFCVVSPDQFKATRVFSTLDKARLLGEARARQSRVGSSQGTATTGHGAAPAIEGRMRPSPAPPSPSHPPGGGAVGTYRIRSVYVRSTKYDRGYASSFISTHDRPAQAYTATLAAGTPTLRENSYTPEHVKHFRGIKR